ncbi:MAG: iron-containing alcohol dehydrogenase [Eubacteriales bacterium]|nr:iron-containing alcohol dehydrogenase [Clostridia bacterium]MDZ4042141.1 iron-containing alcohol dehydrogenase [Eubacteriales bacterium]MDZ7609815.1 iron-containing alcohol dehydrogenase [Eubacteriales bacterium]
MLFDILTPERILFGPGTSFRIPAELERLGKRVLLVSGQNTLQLPENLDRVINPLKSSNLAIHYHRIDPEPSAGTVDRGRELARSNNVDLVVGIGGGSALDTAKAVAGLFHSEEPTSAYLRGREVDVTPIPWVAVPTTAGSGSEVTRNAVLIDQENGKKSSLRHESWMARVAVVDPILTMSMPRQLTAWTGLDALTHAIEAYTSRWVVAPSAALAAEAVRLIVQNFFSAYTTGRKEPREKMALGSLMAGMALNTAGAGLVHALAHPVGSRYNLPHGLVCGVLLPYALEFNMAISVDHYAELGYRSGIARRNASVEEAAEKFVLYVRKLVEKLGVPATLGEQGLRREDIQGFVEASKGGSSLSANVRKATLDDLTSILERAL